MIAKDSLFFKLLRIGLGTETMDNGQCVMDKALSVPDYQFSIKQGVAAFVYDGLQKSIKEGTVTVASVPNEVKMKLFSHTMQVEKVHQRHEAVIGKLAEFYAKHNIRMMVLKGYGLSLYYPVPTHRPCGDIDIWLFGEEERADKLLHEKKGLEIDYGHYHHTVFNVAEVPIENHYNFINSEGHISSAEIEKELKRLVSKEPLQEVKVGNAVIYFPPATFNALFLLRHAGEHFAAAEIALRHLTDWGMFVKNAHTEIDWEWLEQFAKEQNMDKFLHCLNGICMEYLGIPEECFPKCQRDRDLEELIMNDILNPSFEDKSALYKGFIKDYSYRLRRWWGQRWKHKLVYRESLFVTFWVSLKSHLIKPKAYNNY